MDDKKFTKRASSAESSVLQNPTQTGAPKAAYNSNIRADLLGFANRDERTTQSLSLPAVLPKLGMSYQHFLARKEEIRTEITHPEYYAQWKNTTSRTTPGLMVFRFEPIMALDSPFLPSEFRDIFQAEYMKQRLFNNATRDYSSSDLHVMWSALGEIKCHVENIKRILKIICRMVNHSVNQYYSPDVLLKALGFEMTEAEAHENYPNWWRRFNTEIIDQLRNVRWFKDDNIMPGWKRWGALCSEIYKDTPVYTDFCQLYMFIRESMYDIQSALNDQGLYVWTYTKQGIGHKSALTDGVLRFTDYISSVARLVRHVFFDDGSASIISTINTIADRLSSNPRFSFENLDFGNTEWGEEDIPLTYDFNMLCAISNITVCNSEVQAPYVDVTNDVLHQRAYVRHIGGVGGSTGDLIFLSPKLINMPNYGITNNDAIAATQWTLVGTTIGATQGPGDLGISITPGSCGTEIIISADVYSYEFNSSEQATLVVDRLSGSAIPLADWSTTTGVQKWAELLSLLSNFAFAPTLYFVNNAGGYASDPEIVGTFTNQEVVYAGDWNTISSFHKQVVRNFWGYPVDVPATGSFSTSYESAQR